jgi:hypothetical protein
MIRVLKQKGGLVRQVQECQTPNDEDNCHWILRLRKGILDDVDESSYDSSWPTDGAETRPLLSSSTSFLSIFSHSRYCFVFLAILCFMTLGSRSYLSYPTWSGGSKVGGNRKGKDMVDNIFQGGASTLPKLSQCIVLFSFVTVLR